MKYRLLGHSGLRVSQLCLGTMTFGAAGIGSGVEEDRRVFETFAAAGGNFIDTANMYAGGESEKILADLIAKDRAHFVLATKFSHSMRADDPNFGGNHRKNLVQALEASLARLKTDYLDLLWVHSWDSTIEPAVLMRALDDQVRLGKVLHVGISNAPAWVIATCNTIARERGWTPFTAIQPLYNLGQRWIETEHLPLARAEGMAVTPWSPLGGGLLTGKFAKDAPPEARAASRMETTAWGNRYKDAQKLAVADAVARIARESGRSSAQVALAWLMQNPIATVVPIVGARTAAQLEDSLGSVACVLDAATVKRLDEVSAVPPPYPHDLLSSPFMKAMIHGPQVAEKIIA
jgi:aryl-alcohol dehydrogenase-like predicted oxidoreductase